MRASYAEMVDSVGRAEMNGSMNRRAFQTAFLASIGLGCAMMGAPKAFSLVSTSSPHGTRRVNFRYQLKAGVLLTWFRVTDRTNPQAEIPFSLQLSVSSTAQTILKTQSFRSTAKTSHIVRGVTVLPTSQFPRGQPFFARLLLGEESKPTRVMRIGAARVA
jgi:hypothetical protein